jgi:hypothetical protein
MLTFLLRTELFPESRCGNPKTGFGTINSLTASQDLAKKSLGTINAIQVFVESANPQPETARLSRPKS